MKPVLLRLSAALGLLLVLAACQGLDLTPEGDPQRVAYGNVKLRSDMLFPPDAVVVVRVVDLNPADAPVRAPGTELPVADRARMAKAERVLGEQIIRAPGATPIPFRVEFQAEDAMLRRGLNIDVRISLDGKVRYRTMSAHLLTLGSVPFNQEVYVDSAN